MVWPLIAAQAGLMAYNAFQGQRASNEATRDARSGYRKAQKKLKAAYTPWSEAGQGALQGYQGIGEFNPTELRDLQYLQSTPGYQWRLQQGQQAIERSQAAKGALGSGQTLASLQNYAQGLASQEYQNEWMRQLQQHQENRAYYAPLVEKGYNAQTTLGSNLADIVLQREGAGAAATLGQSRSLSQGLSNLSGWLGSAQGGGPGTNYAAISQGVSDWWKSMMGGGGQ